ncbi:MAG: AMIN domain-containing protein, partial [Myxococcota bacterium]
MDRTSIFQRPGTRLSVAVAVLLAWSASVEAGSSNRVVDVAVQGSGDERVIRIQTAAEPTFTVFRLSNPMRVVIDVSGGDVSRLESPYVIEDGIVSSIATRQFDANGFLIGRLTLGFERDVAYDVKAVGKAVVVRTAPSANKLPRRIVAPSAPLTKKATERVDELRREVEAARKLADRERKQADDAKSRAANQLAEAQRLARAAEQSATNAERARTEAAELRREAQAAASRDRQSLEKKAREAEGRLAELQRLAQKLATDRASAERAAAEATRAEREAMAAATRAEALHKRQVAEQQELIARAKAEQAKAASEKEAAEAARIRAVAANRDADRAKAQAEESKRLALRSSEELQRKLGDIDRRERRAQSALARLTAARAEVESEKAAIAQEKKAVAAQQAKIAAQRAAVERERETLRQAKADVAKTQTRLNKAQSSMEQERAAVEQRQARLDSERKRLERLRRSVQRGAKANDTEGDREREELARLKADIERQKREIQKQRSQLQNQKDALRSEKSQLAHRKAELNEREAKLAKVETRKLVREETSRPMLASTSVPSVRGTLKGVERRGDDVLLRIDGHASYELLRVEQPPRLVVRLANVTRGTKRRNYGVNANYVNRVRLGDHENATHAVLDLAGPTVDHSVRTTDEGVLVSLRGKASKASVAAISDVRFAGDSTSARVIIDVADDVETDVDDRSRRAWVLKLTGARVNPKLERSLDTSNYGSVVRLLSTYQASTEPPVVNIVANLRGAASQTLRREGNSLIWELTGVADAPKVATRTETKSPSTAAFRSAATAVSRSVAPAQRRSGQRVTLDFKDADIINVIRLIADTTGENIIAADDVKGKVTVKLRNVPWERALDVILKSRGYDKVRSGGIIRIATAQSIAQEREREIAKRKAQTEVEDTVIKIVTVNYATANDIVEQLKPLLTIRGSVQVDSRTNALIIEDIRSNINRIVNLTTVLDKQTPLVQIEARIVEASSNFEQEFGIQWGGTSQFTRANGNP